MIRRNVNKFRRRPYWPLLTAVCGLCSPLAMGADTDIYLNPSNPNSAPPLIMLTFDWSPSLGSTLCSHYNDAACIEKFGETLHPHLVANIEGPGMLYRDFDGDGVIDDPVVEPFDMIRAVLRALIMDPLTNNMALGIMLPHDDTCSGGTTAGPSLIPAAGSSGCSNGGYILNGFELFSSSDFDSTTSTGLTAGSAREKFLERLGKVPSPHGNVSHKYQLRELYFEFFRYLTGGAVYNGHLGYEDFASTDDTKTLNDTTNTYKTDTSAPVVNDTTAFAWDGTLDNTADAGGTPIAGTPARGVTYTYTSPYEKYSDKDWSCAKTFMINTYFSDIQQADSDGAISASLGAGGMGLSLSGGDSTKTASVIDFLYQNDMSSDTLGYKRTVTLEDDSTVQVPLDGTQNVLSYFITSKSNNNSADDYAFKGGTGRAFKLDTDDPNALLKQLESTLREILSVSTTIVSASVPVNVFNRTDVVNNVYFALFKAESTPRWNGNIKKLKIVDDSTGTETFKLIVAADDVTADAFSNDGRIRHDALTYWTNSNGFDVVATYEDQEISGRDGRSVNRGGAGQQIPGFLSSINASQSGDPGLVNDTGKRKLFTENSAGNGLMALNANTTTATELQNRLGATSATEAENLLKWVRGFDAFDDDEDDSTTDLRPWLMGDPIHARPIAVNYGVTSGSYSQENPNLRIFFGNNDGFIRALKDADSGTEATGKELFAFMPRELMKNVKTLRQNQSASTHPYGVDGAPVAYVVDSDNDGNIETADGDKVYLYSGLRRGGHSYYALDVSDPSDSVTPSLLWRIRNPARFSASSGTTTVDTLTFGSGMTLTPGQLEGGELVISSGLSKGVYPIVSNDSSTITVSAGQDAFGNTISQFSALETDLSYSVVAEGESNFGELGLTFSTPKVTHIKYGLTKTPVLIFAGGYDLDKDNGAADDDEGNAIYIVHATTGELIWKAVKGDLTSTDTTHYIADMVDSIPATVSIFDSDGNGITDRLYVGDTGGAVWRVDLKEGDESDDSSTFSRADNWFVTKLAELGTDGNVTDRRFFHGADLVNAKDSTGEYVGVILASGNRASPLATNVENYLFVIKDRLLTTGADAVKTRTAYTPSDLTDITDLCITGEETACTDADLSTGWRLKLEAAGEKGLSTPITAGGTIFFTTYVPSSGVSGSCEPSEGTGYIYAVRLANGSVDAEIFGINDGATITKDDRHGGSTNNAGSGIPSDPVTMGSDNILLPGKGVGGRQIISTGAKTRWKIYWREKNIDSL